MNPDDPTPSSPATALRAREQATPVGEVYAESLMELANEQQQLDRVAQEVEELSELLERDDGLVRLIRNPIIGRDQRREMLQRLFEGRVSDLLYRFLQVVNRKDRLNALPSIFAAFSKRVAVHQNRLEVDAYVARPLDEATADRVARGLGESLGKQVTLIQHVDESLIGGLKLRIGDQMLDASVQRQLQRIKQQLITAGREKARGLAAAAGAPR